jgi:predicted transcriptional regulator of viral defense system
MMYRWLMERVRPARSLSPAEARVVLGREAEGEETLRLTDIRRLAAVRPGHARKLAHDLVGKGWLAPIGRGRYLLNPGHHGPDRLPDTDPLRYGSRLVDPYYFAYATAAELRGYLAQAGRVYYIATTRRASFRPRHTARFQFVRLAPSRFFGSEPWTRRGEVLRVSNAERTLLDALDRPELSGGLGGVVQIVRGAAREVSWDRLAAYLRRWGNRSLARRVGYWLDHLPLPRRPPARWVASVLPAASEPFVPLVGGSQFPRQGPRDRRWRLIENVGARRWRSEVEPR